MTTRNVFLGSQTPLKLEFIDECGKAIIEESGICFKDLKSRNTQQSVNAEFPAASSPDDIMDNDTGWDEDCTSFQEGLQATTSLQQNSSTSTWQSFPIQNDNFSKGDGRQFRNRDTYGARRHNSNESERGRKRSRRSGSDENDRPNSFQGRSYNDNSDGNGYNGQNSYQRGKPYSDRSKFDRKGRNDNNGAYQRFVPPRMQKGKPSYQNNVNDFGKCNSDARDWDNPSTSWDIPAEDWDNPVEKQGFGSSVMNNTVDIPVPSIENGVYKEMVVVHVCTPSEFFCHLVDSIPTLEKSLSDLQSSYSVLNESELAVTNPQVGMICCAKFSEDGEWYRAKVKSINGTVAEVFFVDYGNVDTINTAQIKVLKSEYCTLPMQALKCSLRSALPVGGKWRKEDIDFFESQTLGKEVLCKFIGKREDDNTVYTVRLMDVSFCDDLLVDYVMIKEGHARPVSLNDCVYRSMVSDHVTCPYPEKAIDSGTMETVVVSWLDSPDRFFCQLQTNEEQLTLLEAELNSFYSSCKPLDFILSEPRPYAACVASYGAPAFEAWYRASILAVDDKDAVVLFVDYGNVETVSRQKVLDIKAEYMHIPVQVI